MSIFKKIGLQMLNNATNNAGAGQAAGKVKKQVTIVEPPG
jgi:hypothetical protein